MTNFTYCSNNYSGLTIFTSISKNKNIDISPTWLTINISIHVLQFLWAIKWKYIHIIVLINWWDSYLHVTFINEKTKTNICNQPN